MGHIYLVRHGQASFGSANYDQLSPLGVEQARLLGQWFANREQSFERVVTGGMQRHRQSASACLAELPKAALRESDWLTDPGFAEFDHVQVLARQHPQLAEPGGFKAYLAGQPGQQERRRAVMELFRAAMLRWMDGEHDTEYDEPWPQFRARCLAALARLNGVAEAGQSTIVFTSGGTISALVQHLLGLTNSKMVDVNLSLANGGVTRLHYRDGHLGLSYLNNFAHLEWLGEAGAVTYF